MDRTTDLDNDQPEYRPNSGFVNKLRSKFSQLENTSNRTVLSKRSASVENLLSDSGYGANEYSSRFKNRHGSASRTSNDDTNVSSTRSSNVILRKPAPQGYKKIERPSSNEVKDRIERPRSNESLYKSADKMPVSRKREVDFSRNNIVKSNKPPLPKKNEVISKRVSRNSSSDYPDIPKIEHHDWKVAPDLEKIGKDNIIIIESSTPAENSEKEKALIKSHNEEVDSVFHHAKPLKEEKDVEDELPKPHTVSAFRSFFEKANMATDTLRVWQSHSPTRKSTGSDLGSPKVTSPINSPRSPYEKVSEDNVFTLTTDKDTQSNGTQRRSSVEKSSISKSSPRNSVDFVADIDTTPTSLVASRSVFQNKTINESSDNFESSKTKGLEPKSSHTLTPLNKSSQIFDSQAIKKDKTNRPKPVVLARKSKEFNVSNHVSDNEVPKKKIPKDTIELKHEVEEQRHSSHDENIEKNVNSIDKVSVYDNVSNISKTDDNKSVAQNDAVLTESLVKPSKSKSGKTSPRKTKIFDSSSMVKKDPLKSPTRVPAKPTFTDKPATSPVTVENDTKDETQMETSPVRPDRRQKPQNNKLPSSGLTPLETNIVKNDSKSQTDTKSPKTNKSQPVFPTVVDRPAETKVPSKSADVGDKPVSGMSSFLANRLKKSDNDSSSKLKTSSSHLLNGTSPSPVPRKRQAPAIPVENGIVNQSIDVEMTENNNNNNKEQIPPALPTTAEPKLPVSNIDDIIKRKKSTPQSSTKMVFDSSKIAVKRKEAPKRKPARKTLQELNENVTFDSPPVPKLDLSSITGEKQESEYQEGYIPTVIKPCNIKFVGECVVLQKSPYKKTKKSKVKIGFDDHATTTFEYEREESALENYLMEHPNEREEAERQEEEVNNALESTVELLNDSPRAPEPDVSSLKSSIGIGASGELTSYKSKMQTQDFQFGMSMEPEPVYESRYHDDDDENQEDNMQILPADDSELDTFSAEVGKSDMLF